MPLILYVPKQNPPPKKKDTEASKKGRHRITLHATGYKLYFQISCPFNFSYCLFCRYLIESDYKFETNSNPTPVPCFFVSRSPTSPRKPSILDIISSIPRHSYGGNVLSPMSTPRGGTPVRQSPSSTPPSTPPRQRAKKMVQMCAAVDSFPADDIAANLHIADVLQDSQ